MTLSPNVARARAEIARALNGDLGLGTSSGVRPSSAKSGGGGGSAAAAPKAKAAAAAAKEPSPAKKPSPATAAAAAPYDAPRAEEARAAVLAAAAALPSSKGQLDFSILEEAQAAPVAGGGAGRPDDTPPNAGAVPPPTPGHPDAFKGLTFVISGVLDSLHREEAAFHIQRHGGRVTGSVSGKTNFLLVGHKAGRSKTAAAEAKRESCKLIDERGLRTLIAASVPFKPKEEEELEEEMPVVAVKKSGSPSAAAVAAPPSTSAPPPSTSALPSAPAPPPSTSAPPVTGNRGADLWVDKHRPVRSSELVGNPGAIGTLRQWLVMW